MKLNRCAALLRGGFGDCVCDCKVIVFDWLVRRSLQLFGGKKQVFYRGGFGFRGDCMNRLIMHIYLIMYLSINSTETVGILTGFPRVHFQKLPHFNAWLNSDGYGDTLSFFQCRMRYLCIENEQCILWVSSCVAFVTFGLSHAPHYSSLTVNEKDWFKNKSSMQWQIYQLYRRGIAVEDWQSSSITDRKLDRNQVKFHVPYMWQKQSYSWVF